MEVLAPPKSTLTCAIGGHYCVKGRLVQVKVEDDYAEGYEGKIVSTLVSVDAAARGQRGRAGTMATNRLRKRLDSTEESTLLRVAENFCLIGTPLPSLDKRDANEYKPVWEQEVRDEQGRRRFHGAFTGGFSAGYYNSVGSKEGWTPSTFRSSRKDKEKNGRGEGTSQGRNGTGGAAGSRPEDFMDEEDLEALREGRGALGSTQTYQMQQEESQQQREKDPLMHMLGLTSERRSATAATAGEEVASIQIASQSLGLRVLQKMGWRPGQGLGPRVTFKKRRKLIAMLGFTSNKEEEDDKEAEKHLWPPPDTPMPTFSTKNDAAGLGWVRQSRDGRLDEALKRARADASRDTHKTEARPGGFGLGALEDDSDGEDDVYAIGHRIEDSSLARSTPRWEDGRDRVVLGDSAVKIGTKLGLTGAEIGSVDRQYTNDNVWHDGRSVLPGFRIASKASLTDEPWFAAPEVPKGWTPNPQLVWSQAATVTKGKVSGSNMTASERASILGEARLPGPPPAISDYLSQKEREKVERGKAAAEEVAAGASEAVRKEGPPPMSIPRLDAEVAKSALQGFIPFENEPAKQARYRAYLESQVNPSGETLHPTSSQSEGHFINELREFAKSAGIFKPMSTVMASRFQSSAGGSNDLPQINPGLFIPERKPALSVAEEQRKARQEKAEEEEKRKTEELKTLTPAQRNARLNLFGEGKTRDVKMWKPSRLLCKRFNVPEPYPEQDEKSTGQDGGGEEEGRGNLAGSEALEAAFGASKVRKMIMPNINARWEESKRQLQQLASLQTTPLQDPSFAIEGDAAPREGQKEGRAGVVDVGNIGLGEVQPDKNEEVFDKPSIDIFKAVFADDDESSDDDDDDDKNDKAADDMTPSSAKPITTTNRGIAGAASQEEIVNTAGISRTDEDHKLLFVPRKRRADDEDKLKKRDGKKDGEKKSKKSKSMTLLTFSVDDEEESDGQAKQADRKPAKRENRPKAADLFL